MKNYIYGLMTGLLIALFFFIINGREMTPNTSKLEILLEENDKSPVVQSATVPVEEALDLKLNRRDLSEKNIFKTTSSSEIPSNTLIANDLQDKRKIIEMLDSFSSNDLARIESIITHLNDKTPAERFDSEAIDANWSLKKQVELEYTFYEQSLLKDLGTLDSIKCKSQLCLITVQVPADIELKPSHYMDWSNPVSVSIKPDQENTDLKILEIYISRD